MANDAKCCERALVSCNHADGCEAAPVRRTTQRGADATRTAAATAGFLVALVGGWRAWRRRRRVLR
jgi:hypothetical protein